MQLGLDAPRVMLYHLTVWTCRLSTAVKPPLVHTVRSPVDMALWLSVWETRGESGGVRDDRLRSVFHAASVFALSWSSAFLWGCLPPGY